eukprot:Seg2713.3 transcript_id=Seg2713.3/GoldUCD/mRNA.D3Y31 product="hypothetical protein" protein_id=Seg2713.3/GoldUCD/D3Y31
MCRGILKSCVSNLVSFQELLWRKGWGIGKFKVRVAIEFALCLHTKFYFADQEGTRLFRFRPGTIYIETERSRKRPATEEEEDDKKRRQDEEVRDDYYEESEIRYYDVETNKEDSREVLAVGSKRRRSEPEEAPRRVSESKKARRRVSAFRRLGNDAKVKYAVQKWLGDAQAVQRKMKAARNRAGKDKSPDLCRAFLGLLHILAEFNKMKR